MDRGESDAPLSVEEAKARVRLAAARAEPTVQMAGAVRTRPLQGVALFFVAGLLLGATPQMRQTMGSLITSGLAAFGPGLIPGPPPPAPPRM